MSRWVAVDFLRATKENLVTLTDKMRALFDGTLAATERPCAALDSGLGDDSWLPGRQRPDRA